MNWGDPACAKCDAASTRRIIRSGVRYSRSVVVFIISYQCYLFYDFNFIQQMRRVRDLVDIEQDIAHVQ